MKHLNKLSAIMLIFLAFILGLAIYWLYIEPDIIVVEETNALPVDKKVYTAGETVVYTVEYCKSKKSVATVYRSLVDSYQIPFAQSTSDLPTGCNKVNIPTIKIPSFIKGGGDSYHIEITAVYRINPIRFQYVYLRTENFRIK